MFSRPGGADSSTSSTRTFATTIAITSLSQAPTADCKTSGGDTGRSNKFLVTGLEAGLGVTYGLAFIGSGYQGRLENSILSLEASFNSLEMYVVNHNMVPPNQGVMPQEQQYHPCQELHHTSRAEVEGM